MSSWIPNYNVPSSWGTQKLYNFIFIFRQFSIYSYIWTTYNTKPIPPVHSVTYFPKSFMMPLDFFLESGDDGEIWKGLLPWESFGRGDTPARSRCSAVSFSVSAIPRTEYKLNEFLYMKWTWLDVNLLGFNNWWEFFCCSISQWFTKNTLQILKMEYICMFYSIVNCV